MLCFKSKEYQVRAVVQRVTECEVHVHDQAVGRIGPGLLVLLGISRSDEEKDADYLADKIAHLRIFEDADGKMNRSADSLAIHPPGRLPQG